MAYIKTWKGGLNIFQFARVAAVNPNPSSPNFISQIGSYYVAYTGGSCLIGQEDSRVIRPGGSTGASDVDAVLIGNYALMLSKATATDITLSITRYNLTTGASDTPFSEKVMTDTSVHIYHSCHASICYNPDKNKVYIVASGLKFDVDFVMDHTSLRAWECSALGVKDHRILTIETAGNAKYYPPSGSIAESDGALYFYGMVGGSSTRYLWKVDSTATDRGDGDISTVYSGTSAQVQGGLPYKLYLHIPTGASTLKLDGAATTWNLSSYWDDTTRNILFLGRDSTNDFYIITPHVSNLKLYYLKLTNAGSVTKLAELSVASTDFMPANSGYERLQTLKGSDFIPYSGHIWFGSSKARYSWSLQDREVS